MSERPSPNPWSSSTRPPMSSNASSQPGSDRRLPPRPRHHHDVPQRMETRRRGAQNRHAEHCRHPNHGCARSTVISDPSPGPATQRVAHNNPCMRLWPRAVAARVNGRGDAAKKWVGVSGGSGSARWGRGRHPLRFYCEQRKGPGRQDAGDTRKIRRKRTAISP